MKSSPISYNGKGTSDGTIVQSPPGKGKKFLLLLVLWKKEEVFS